VEDIHIDERAWWALREDKREQVLTWLRSLGVDTGECAPALHIEVGEQGYLLHLSRRCRDEAGRLRIDHALGQLVYEPLVITLGTEPSWPAWLTPTPAGVGNP
jgi:hypothetical protein